MLVSILPGMATAAAPKADDLSIYDVGPELRAKTPSMGQIDLSSADSSSGGSAAAEPYNYVVGDQAEWMGLDDYDGGYYFNVYSLRAASETTEIWVANNLAWPSGDARPTPVITEEQLNYLLAEFDDNILPTMSNYFRAPDAHDGSNSLLEYLEYFEPGYFSGDKLVVLVDNIKDDNYYDPTYPSYIAGFYSPSYEQYFDRNIITIDAYDWANRIGPDAAKPYLYEGIIAHEFQHLLHDDVDSDEETFLNEGLADFAMVVCGYASAADHLDELREKPENSLVAWEDQGGLEILADYGLAFLWTYYLWEQHGTAFIKAMFNDPNNGIVSIESLLQAKSKKLHFDDTFRDFSIAMLIDSSMSNYRYGFRTLDFKVDLGTVDAPNLEAYSTPGAPAWGTDYLPIYGKALKSTKLVFDGIPNIQKPTGWTSVDGALWSGEGDLVDNWAIFEATGGGTLTFDTIYDIEDYWDFGFVQVSTDHGATWTSLANDYTTDLYDLDAYVKVIDNVPGLTSYITGPVTMSFDLSAYSGQQILIGFRYVTDWATSYGGWFVDNVFVDSALISDGSDAAVFYDLTHYQPIDVDYSLTLVGFKQTSHGTQYKILTLGLDHRTNDGTFAVQDVLSWSQKAVLLVTYQADAGNVDYAGYSWELKQTRR